MVVAAYLVDPPVLRGLLSETLRDESQLTSRLKRLPDDYNLDTHEFVQSSIDTNSIRLKASRYAARGLLPIANLLGSSPWYDRLVSLVEDLVAISETESPFSQGPLPSGAAEINGNLLRALIWLSSDSGDEAYLDLAYRIGDSYCLGILPKNGGLPAAKWDWNLDRAIDPGISLSEDGLVIIEGLVILYGHEMRSGGARAEIYRPTLGHMFNMLLDQARTPDGRFVSSIKPDNRGGFLVEGKSATAAWPRLLQIIYEFGEISGNTRYTEPVFQSVRRFQTSTAQASVTARTGFHLINLLMDLEKNNPGEFMTGSRNLLDSLAVRTSKNPSLDEEIESARFMATYSTVKTGGLRLIPWSEELTWGTVVKVDTLFISMESSTDWEGVLRSSRPRGLLDGALNGLISPDPFTTSRDDHYRMKVIGTKGSAIWSGDLFRQGIKVSLQSGRPIRLRIVRITRPPGESSSTPDEF
jgi:hypothetical protein